MKLVIFVVSSESHIHKLLSYYKIKELMQEQEDFKLDMLQ